MDDRGPGFLRPTWRFATFRGQIGSLPPRVLEREDLHTTAFRLCAVGRIEIYYAPFDWVNRAARVVLLGSSPGWHETELAFRALCAALRAGDGEMTALRKARLATIPSGPLRQGLSRMLDAAGIHHAVSVGRSSRLFEPDRSELHWTWAVRYPAVVSGQDYDTTSPSLLACPILREFVVDALAGELAAIPNAVIVPLGAAAASAVWLLVRLGLLERARVGPSLPDPTLWRSTERACR